MKLFAQRYMYLGTEVVTPPAGIDAIASHDLQTPLRIPSVLATQQPPVVSTPMIPTASSPPANNNPNGTYAYPHPYNPPGAAASSVPANSSTTALGRNHSKMASPHPPKRPLAEPDAGNAPKRARRSPPPPAQRRGGGPPPPALAQRRWGSPPPDDRRRDRPRSPDRNVVPPSVMRFLSQLPNAAAYDGAINVISVLFVKTNSDIRAEIQDGRVGQCAHAGDASSAASCRFSY